MNREIPPKIWVPVLLACAPIPVMVIKSHATLSILVLGILGAGAYLTINAARAKRRRFAFAYGFSTFVLIGIIGRALEPPPNPQLLTSSRPSATLPKRLEGSSAYDNMVNRLKAEEARQAYQRRQYQLNVDHARADYDIARQQLRDTMDRNAAILQENQDRLDRARRASETARQELNDRLEKYRTERRMKGN